MKLVFLHSQRNDDKEIVKSVRSLCRSKSFEFQELALDYPSETYFDCQLERIKQAVCPETLLIFYCFGGTYALYLSAQRSVEKFFAIDPPSGVKDRNGEQLKLEELEDNATLIGSTEAQEGLPENIQVEEIFDTCHFFEDKVEEFTHLINQEIMDIDQEPK